MTTKLAIALLAVSAWGQPENSYREVLYRSGGLKIQAYLYQPARKGPFPAVVYNHGSRIGNERRPTPFVPVGRMLAEAGYVVLVPERRGYGTSDGMLFSEEVGTDPGERFVKRMEDEAGDVLAAVEYLKTLSEVDAHRIGLVGWSLGGIVSVLAASRSTGIGAVVNQAGASLTWDASPAIQKALLEAAAKIRVPLLGMVAENDRTTKAVEAVVESAKKGGGAARLVVYPKYTPPENPRQISPGHLIFAADGMDIWRGDVLRFLGDALKAR